MDLAGKLQLKTGQSVAIVNSPADAALELSGHPIAARGVQPVRQVSLDEVWSALGLRPV